MDSGCWLMPPTRPTRRRRTARSSRPSSDRCGSRTLLRLATVPRRSAGSACRRDGEREDAVVAGDAFQLDEPRLAELELAGRREEIVDERRDDDLATGRLIGDPRGVADGVAEEVVR